MILVATPDLPRTIRFIDPPAAGSTAEAARPQGSDTVGSDLPAWHDVAPAAAEIHNVNLRRKAKDVSPRLDNNMSV
eukprot:COSAG01_NODE_1247_length_11073_cov_23.273465_15_plen_76_part_00